MKEDTLKDIINDTRDLAATRKNPMTRLALEGIANRLETLVAMAANPPMSEDVKKHSWLELPRGVTLRRFCGADRSVTYVGQYRSTDPGELGASNSRPLRVYQVRVDRRACTDTAWEATVMENDEIIFGLQTTRGGRAMAERVAVKALKAWLRYLSHNKGKESRKRHRKALKQRKKAARRAARMAEEGK